VVKEEERDHAMAEGEVEVVEAQHPLPDLRLLHHKLNLN
jgi:glycerate-2-kinase